MPSRDRTHKADIGAEYLDGSQYAAVAIMLAAYHCILEIVYLAIDCTPMAIINILSILAYVVSLIFVAFNKYTFTIWIMLIEVYLHVVFATLLMGTECGFMLWLFGAFCSVFLPYFSPTITKKQQIQIGLFGTLMVITFIVFTAMHKRFLLPAPFKPSEIICEIFYYVNAVVGFSSMMLYTTIYNKSMNSKNAELQKMADHDYLTGIFNRQRILRILTSELDLEKENGENKISIAIMDLDLFKNVNDTYGHNAGDLVLKNVVKIFEKYEKEGLLYGRWGGEEFLLIAPENYSYESFCDLLNTIRESIATQDFISNNEIINITASFGAAHHEKGMTIEAFIHLADSRLYTAKETGKNKVISE